MNTDDKLPAYIPNHCDQDFAPYIIPKEFYLCEKMMRIRLNGSIFIVFCHNLKKVAITLFFF